MKHTEALCRPSLYVEMLGRIQQTDSVCSREARRLLLLHAHGTGKTILVLLP